MSLNKYSSTFIAPCSLGCICHDSFRLLYTTAESPQLYVKVVALLIYDHDYANDAQVHSSVIAIDSECPLFNKCSQIVWHANKTELTKQSSF